MRIYVVTEKEAEKSPDVIVGKAHINGKLAHILIDPSAIYSFTLTTFVMHDKLKINDLNEPVIVSVHMDMCVICKKVCRNILIEINGDKMKWNFILLYLDKFDTILGIDGLSHYRANVNYFAKQVELEEEGGKKIIFIGGDRKTPIKIISMMKGKKYIRK